MAGFMDKVKAVGRKIKESGTIIEEIKNKAIALNKKIVLCEGEDSRVVEAAAECVQDKIARIVLLGNADKIKLANPEVDLTGVEIVNPETSPKLDRKSVV